MSHPAGGPTGLRAGTTDISPVSRVALYILTTLLALSAAEPGWTAVAFLWFALGSLFLALRAIEAEPSPPEWCLAVSVPGAAVLLALDATGSDTTGTSRAILAAALVAAGLLIFHLIYPAGVTRQDRVLLVSAVFHLAWLDWQAATIGLLACFGSLGLFAATLLLRNRPIANEAIPFSPFIYLGVLAGIALT